MGQALMRALQTIKPHVGTGPGADAETPPQPRGSQTSWTSVSTCHLHQRCPWPWLLPAAVFSPQRWMCVDLPAQNNNGASWGMEALLVASFVSPLPARSERLEGRMVSQLGRWAGRNKLQIWFLPALSRGILRKSLKLCLILLHVRNSRDSLRGEKVVKVCGLNGEHAQVGWGTQAFCLLAVKVSQWHKSLEFVVFHFYFFLVLGCLPQKPEVQLVVGSAS